MKPNIYYLVVLTTSGTKEKAQGFLEYAVRRNKIKRQNLDIAKCDGRYKVIRRMSHKEALVIGGYWKDRYLSHLQDTTASVKKWYKRRKK